MKSQAKYLILLIFILVVILAMFFIYSNINSPEKIVYYQEKPKILEKVYCIIRGGALEILEDGAINSEDGLAVYLCHFH